MGGPAHWLRGGPQLSFLINIFHKGSEDAGSRPTPLVGREKRREMPNHFFYSPERPSAKGKRSSPHDFKSEDGAGATEGKKRAVVAAGF